VQYAFVSFATDFTCLSDLQSLTNKCFDDNRDSCQALQFSVEQSSSIVSEWSLVCDQNYKSKGTMSAFMAGVMLGAFVLGKLADSIGRKNSMTLTVVGIVFFNTLSALTTSFQLYVVAKFCVGFFCAGNILAMFVLGNELVGPSKRGIFGVTLQAAFAVGIVVLSMLAYHVQHWRQLTLLISVMGLPFILYHWIIPESPRWLLSQNRLHEAVKIMEDIAKGNGTVLSEKVKLELDSPKKTDVSTPASARSEGLTDLFRHRQLGVLTVIQIYSWYVNSAAYYGLTLAAGSAGGGLYTATALSGAVEIPAYVLTNFLLDYLGRRKTLCLFMIGGGLSCLTIQLLAGTYHYHYHYLHTCKHNSLLRQLPCCSGIICPAGQAVSGCQLCCGVHPQWGDIPNHHQELCHGAGVCSCQVRRMVSPWFCVVMYAWQGGGYHGPLHSAAG